MIPVLHRLLHSLDAMRDRAHPVLTPPGGAARRGRRFRCLRTLVALVLAGAVAVGALAGAPRPAAAQDGDDPGREDTGIDRVLVISVPGLTWAELRDHDLPAIEGLLADSALADMAPRGVSAPRRRRARRT